MSLTLPPPWTDQVNFSSGNNLEIVMKVKWHNAYQVLRAVSEKALH